VLRAEEANKVDPFIVNDVAREKEVKFTSYLYFHYLRLVEILTIIT